MAHEIIKKVMTAHMVELTQAERVVKKFGGPGPLHRCLNAHGFKICRAAVYRWLMLEKPGTGGTIPNQSLKKVCAVATLEGILLTQEDIDPRPREVRLPRHDRERAQQEGTFTRPIVSVFEKDED